MTGRSWSQVVRFGVVGCLATATHVAVFYTLMRGFGISPTVATTVAFCCAFGVSYALNRSWTFRARGSHARHLPRVLIIALMGAGLNAGIMEVGVHRLGWTPTTCLAIIILVVPGFSFLTQRYWGFR